MAKRNSALRKDCPFEAAMDVLSGKWKGMILFRLMKKPLRFNELKQSIQGISQKVLSTQLKELETAKLLERNVYPETPVKVEYQLTAQGKALEKAFELIREWGKGLL